MSKITAKFEELLGSVEQDTQEKIIAAFGTSKFPTAKQIDAARAAMPIADRIFDLIEERKTSANSLGLIETHTNPEEATIPSALIEEARHRIKNGDDLSDAELIKAALDGQWSRNVVILMCSNRMISPHVWFSIMANMKKQPWVGYMYEHDTIIQRARNVAAHKFLQGEAEWSLWWDDDVVAPFGDPGYFYDRLKADQKVIPPEAYKHLAVTRLLSHKKSMVGGIYFERNPGGRSITQPGLYPQNPRDKGIAERIAKGPTDRLETVDWIATGMALVHRSVYEDIMANNPQLAPKNPKEPFNFFGHDVSVEGEDIAFCNLAKKAGHQPHLDMGLFCKHIGPYAY